MTTTLTERYIAAAAASLPVPMQRDVKAELEALIADATEARIEQGEPQEQAERHVLTELGDPAILAATYAERPLHLIGPKYYLTWLRLLKLFMVIVPLCAGLGVAIAQSLIGSSIGTIFAETIAIMLAAVVHVAFWVTLVFIILERTGAETGVSWSVDDLPDTEDTRTRRRDMIASLVFLGIAAVAILWDRFIGAAWVTGERLSILNPDLWPWWIVALYAFLAAEVLFALVLFVRGRWTLRLAVSNTMIGVLFVSWILTVLSRGILVNPEFVDAVFTSNGISHDTVRIIGVVIGFVATGIAAWDIADGWIKLSRNRTQTTV